MSPTDLGSGGGAWRSSYAGGDGGGRGLISAINLVNDGRIAADGLIAAGSAAGGGSGGNVSLTLLGSAFGHLRSLNGGDRTHGDGFEVHLPGTSDGYLLDWINPSVCYTSGEHRYFGRNVPWRPFNRRF